MNIATDAHTSCEYMAFTDAHYRAPRKARANNEKLMSAWNEHKNKRFYVYENVMRL